MIKLSKYGAQRTGDWKPKSRNLSKTHPEARSSDALGACAFAVTYNFDAHYLKLVPGWSTYHGIQRNEQQRFRFRRRSYKS